MSSTKWGWFCEFTSKLLKIILRYCSMEVSRNFGWFRRIHRISIQLKISRRACKSTGGEGQQKTGTQCCDGDEWRDCAVGRVRADGKLVGGVDSGVVEDGVVEAREAQRDDVVVASSVWRRRKPVRHVHQRVVVQLSLPTTSVCSSTSYVAVYMTLLASAADVDMDRNAAAPAADAIDNVCPRGPQQQNLQQANGIDGRRDRKTDRQTDTVSLHIPCRIIRQQYQ